MNHKGFTLIETMVAITVLALALTGPFIAVRSALTASYVARDQLIASSLAQEGLEYIRSIRDNNFLGSRSWMDGLSSFSCYGASPSGYCTVDPTQGDVHTSSSAMTSYSSTGAVPYLYLSSTDLYNQQTSGTATRFKRYIQLRVVGATEVEVKAFVTWTSAGTTYSVQVNDIIRDWP